MALVNREGWIPEWEELGYTPAVFRKSAELTVWKEVVKRSLRKKRAKEQRVLSAATKCKS
jgi:hypothetical protein